jgi:hypothetical protein
MAGLAPPPPNLYMSHHSLSCLRTSTLPYLTLSLSHRYARTMLSSSCSVCVGRTSHSSGYAAAHALGRTLKCLLHLQRSTVIAGEENEHTHTHERESAITTELAQDSFTALETSVSLPVCIDNINPSLDLVSPQRFTTARCTLHYGRSCDMHDMSAVVEILAWMRS